MTIRKYPARLAQFRNDCELVGLLSFGKTHLDSGEVEFLAKQLEYVEAKAYRKEYPALKALQILPINTQVPSGAETYTYLMWDFIGSAKIVVDYANDFPDANASVTRVNAPIVSIGNGYSYTIQELRAAQAVQFGQGMPLDSLRSEAARNAHAQTVDQIAAYGDSAHGLAGFVVNSAIPDTSPVNGSWNSLTNSDADNGKRIADLNKLCQAPEQATLGIHVANTLILALSLKPELKQPTSTYVRQPLIDNWFQNQDDIKQIIWWNKLDSASSAGALAANKQYAMAFDRSPEVVEFVVPQPFEQFAPQQRNLAFYVICHSRVGGVCLRYPLACARMQLHS